MMVMLMKMKMKKKMVGNKMMKRAEFRHGLGPKSQMPMSLVQLNRITTFKWAFVACDFETGAEYLFDTVPLHSPIRSNILQSQLIICRYTD